MIQNLKLINVIDEINLEFEPLLRPPRGGHRVYNERELIKDCDQSFIFSIIEPHKTGIIWQTKLYRQVQPTVLKKSWMSFLKIDSTNRYIKPSNDSAFCKSDAFAANYLLLKLFKFTIQFKTV